MRETENEGHRERGRKREKKRAREGNREPLRRASVSLTQRQTIFFKQLSFQSTGHQLTIILGLILNPTERPLSLS